MREVYCTEKKVHKPAHDAFSCLECPCSSLFLEPDGTMSCHKEEIGDQTKSRNRNGSGMGQES